MKLRQQFECQWCGAVLESPNTCNCPKTPAHLGPNPFLIQATENCRIWVANPLNREPPQEKLDIVTDFLRGFTRASKAAKKALDTIADYFADIPTLEAQAKALRVIADAETTKCTARARALYEIQQLQTRIRRARKAQKGKDESK